MRISDWSSYVCSSDLYSSPLSLFVTPDLIRGPAALDEAQHSEGKRDPDQVRGDGKLTSATGTTRRRQSPALLPNPRLARQRHRFPRGGEQCAAVRLALPLFIFRGRIRDDAGPCLPLHHPVPTPGRPQPDAAIPNADRTEIAD